MSKRIIGKYEDGSVKHSYFGGLNITVLNVMVFIK